VARLAGRTAIVTGGAKGIGRHYSLALAGEGARVMIADIADGEDVARAIAAKHGANSVGSTVADVSDESAVKMLVAATMDRFGKMMFSSTMPLYLLLCRRRSAPLSMLSSGTR
jgi:NAD(P)-dependent dehydrogenase (short-subunit alcohol dehydrogenase family)